MTGLPEYWPDALLHLKRKDRVLAGVVKNYNGEGLLKRGDPYRTLVRAIVGQQISTLAAAAIWRRMETSLIEINPKGVLSIGEEKLRDFGLTRQKSKYIHGLANSFVSGEVGTHIWQDQDSESVINSLIKINGIGRWTAEMFLIFHLARPDVLPLRDLGLRKGISILYGKGRNLSDSEMYSIAEVWRPWRSVATWYIWRSLDPEPVNY